MRDRLASGAWTASPVERVVRDPRFEALVPADAVVSRLADGAIWAEGPVYLPDEDAVVWSDVRGNVVRRWSEADGVRGALPAVRLRERPHARPRRADPRLRARPAARRRATSATARGRRSWIGSRASGSTRPNDIVVASDGAIWFTDPPYGILDDNEGYKADSELGGCFVFRLDRVTGELAVVSDDLVHPNGLAFSPDETTLYVSDTSIARIPGGNHHIMAFDVVDLRRLAVAAHLRGHRARRLGRLAGRRRGQPLDVVRRRDPGPTTRRRVELGRILLPEEAGQLHVRRRRTAGGCSSPRPRPCGRSTSASAAP